MEAVKFPTATNPIIPISDATRHGSTRGVRRISSEEAELKQICIRQWCMSMDWFFSSYYLVNGFNGRLVA